MNRRIFIKALTALASSLPIVPATGRAASLVGESAVSSSATSKEGVAPDRSDRIVTSIHANFGHGFTLRSADTDEDRWICVIEHAGNVYHVSSADLCRWSIDRSTDM